MASPTDRLLTQLNTSGLQVKDNPLYQVIKQLIGIIKDLESVIGGGSGGGGGSSVTNYITNIQQVLSSEDGGGGNGGEMGPPGVAGISGANGMVPTFIAAGETFFVPEFKQALFEMTIDNEGILDIEGFLVQVD